MKENRPAPTEEEEQVAVVEWCDLVGIPVVHIPNEGKRSVIAGARLKRAGLRAGFPDLFIPRARNGYHGLFVEMKTARGRLSDDQKTWLALLQAEGYAVCVRRGADEAINTIAKYCGRKGSLI